jgi:exodeoxyribonuclease-5
MEDLVLSTSQQAVVDAFPGFLLSQDTEMTISGAAGTGKTFLVQYLTKMAPAQQKLVQLLDPLIHERNFAYTATTNKAAEVLRGTLNKPTSTIHSTLGLRVRNDYSTGKQVLVPHTPPTPLRHTVIFVDEASMINDQLAKAIRGAVKSWNDCKIVFIGDKYQLPPVKEDICSIFRPNAPNVHELLEIQRQAKGSPIISLGTKYRKLLDNPSETWPEIVPDGKNIFLYDDKDSYFNAIRGAYRSPHDPDDVRIIAWSNSRVNSYNKWVRSNVLGHAKPFVSGDIVSTNKPLFMDKQIIAPTDFCLEIAAAEWGPNHIDGISVDGWWISFNFLGTDETVFQPEDWGRVKAIQKVYAKDKNWGPYFNIKDNWADLRPIHANTVHKAQGSTYRKVFVDLADIGRNTRWRDLVRMLYVAITRASHEVHIYGDISVNHEIRNPEDTLEAFNNVQRLLQY